MIDEVLKNTKRVVADAFVIGTFMDPETDNSARDTADSPAGTSPG